MRPKKLVMIGTALALGIGLTACSGGGGTGSDRLVIYATMQEGNLGALEEILAEEFPDVQYEVVSGSAGELTARIQSESGNPQGDMIWGGVNTADGDEYADIFEAWVSEYDAENIEEFQSTNDLYSIAYVSTVVFAVNTDIEKELGVAIASYEDLLDPKLKGRVLLADPASSSSAWNNLSNIMAVFGNDSDDAWEYIQALLENDLVIASSSSAPFTSVADGEYAVGLTYEDGAAGLVKAGAENLRLVYPEEGTSASLFGSAVIKGGPNSELAKEVIDYLTSPEGQVKFGELSGVQRMTTSESYDAEFIPSIDEIHMIDRDTEWLTEHRDEIVGKWIDLYTRYGSRG